MKKKEEGKREEEEEYFLSFGPKRQLSVNA
jgi:hypothetical protein